MGGTSSNGIIWVELNLSAFTDKDRGTLISGITQNAQKSPLWVNQPFQDSVNNLGKLGPALTLANAVVAVDEGKLAADRTVRDDARDATDKELIHYKNLVQHYAQSDADVTASNLKPRMIIQALAQPAPPPGIDVILGNVKGRFAVTAQETGSRKQYQCQAAIDPILPTTVWDTLPGSTKRHVITTYPSGTKVWVRYAVVRRGVLSVWCTAVMVTVP